MIFISLIVLQNIRQNAQQCVLPDVQEEIMAEVIIMPKLGFNMNEGKLVEWYKNEGDAVAKGEPLFSVETREIRFQ